MLLPDTPVIMANVAWPEPVSGHGSNAGPGKAARTGAVADLVRDAVADGALLVDVGRPGVLAVESIRATHPEVIICADAPGADLTRDPAIAERTGAALLRSAPASPAYLGAARLRRSTPPPPPASGAARFGPAAKTGTTPTGTAPAETVLVEAAPVAAAALVAAGHAVLADADAGELAATIAVASVLAWLGVRVVRTRHVAAVRQALGMVESVRGTRAPAWTRRGLA